MDFNSIDDISDHGFQGFVPIQKLMNAEGTLIVDNKKGVYFVLRISKEPPKFLEIGTGAIVPGKVTNDPISVLESKWVDGTIVMYIGMAKISLRKRLQKYMRFGMGLHSNHHGGRHIWQLADSRELLVCWYVLPWDVDPETFEKAIISEFKEIYGKYPFANRRL